jgi:hypothetical protein
MSREALEAALRKGDPPACRQLLPGVPADQRAAVSDVAVRLHKLADDLRWSQRREAEGKKEFPKGVSLDQVQDAALVVIWGLGTLSQAKAVGRWMTCGKDAAAWAVLRDRRPAWITEWATDVLSNGLGPWLFVRWLVLEGLCEPPECDNYFLGVIEQGRHAGDGGMREYLLKDPGLLETHVWPLFRFEGTTENNLAARDKYCAPKNTWTAALVELSREGKLSRERLLDESLNALQRDFAQFRAGWFSRLHEELSPTLEEREARRDRYLALLASRIPPTVSFALKALAILDKAERLPAAPFMDHVRPALKAEPKATVILALKLLGHMAESDKKLKGRAAMFATEALIHTEADVQAAALDLLERHGIPTDPKLAGAVSERMDGISASLRTRSRNWLKVKQASPPVEAAGNRKADEAGLSKRIESISKRWKSLAGLEGGQTGPLAFQSWEIPHLDPEGTIAPVRSLRELIDLASGCLERYDSVEDLERLLDGISRMGTERPDDFGTLIGPLEKRISKLLKNARGAPFLGDQPQFDLCALYAAWFGGRVGGTAPADWQRKQRPSLQAFLSKRVEEVADRVSAGKVAPLLSLPTHRGGWIDPRSFVRRLKEAPSEPGRFDLLTGLHRLTPEFRTQALKEARALRGEIGEAVRQALGDDGIKIGSDAALWVAAARSRSPFQDYPELEKRFGELGPGAARVGEFRIRHIMRYEKYPRLEVQISPPFPKQPLIDVLPVLMHEFNAGNRIGDEAAGAEMQRTTLWWAASLWPAVREPIFASGVLRLEDNLDWWEARWGDRVYEEFLLDPDTPWGSMAAWLLALGLAAKEAGQSGLATDALIAGIEDGRFNSEALGAVMADLLPSGMVKAARWAKVLQNTAQPSPLHKASVHALIERTLRGDAAKAPRDLQALLELFHELSVETGAAVADTACREFLQGLGSGGKTGKLTKALLSLREASERPLLAEAGRCALLRRVERAERWQRWGMGQQGP